MPDWTLLPEPTTFLLVLSGLVLVISNRLMA